MQRTETTVQQDIYIQDVIFNGKSGEAPLSSTIQLKNQANCIYEPADYESDSRTSRMVHHLIQLIRRTEGAHLQQKDHYPILVTRLVMDEFSLYTKDKPLSVEEYKQLIDNLYEIVKSVSPNIHLIIGTVPVQWPDATIRNCALYVEAPLSADDKPLIHHFFKESKSPIDLRYASTEGNIYKAKAQSNDTAFSPDVVLQGCKVMLNDINQYRSALKIELADGISFLTVMEICLDHNIEVGEKNLLCLIAKLIALGKHVPLHLSHVIISASIQPNAASLLSTLTQADPQFNTVAPISTREELVRGDFGQPADITTYEPRKLHIPHRYSILETLLILTTYDIQDLLRVAAHDANIDFDENAVERLESLLNLGADFNALGQEGNKFLVLLTELSAIHDALSRELSALCDETNKEINSDTQDSRTQQYPSLFRFFDFAPSCSQQNTKLEPVTEPEFDLSYYLLDDEEKNEKETATPTHRQLKDTSFPSKSQKKINNRHETRQASIHALRLSK